MAFFRVVDPAFFLIADPDPDSNAYPDPVPDPGFDNQKLRKFTTGKFFKFCLDKYCNLLIPRPP
jgi:hypothetical protein